MIDEFFLNDIVQMKKPHACKTNEWRIIRTGADVKIRCLACGRIVMFDRQEFIRSAKKILIRASDGNDNEG
ncbi:MAG: DUF951 domain-containing protein [Clostridia bacterium]|nr:DUF951 domain-containing protein [Clostridia bacterium]